MVSILIVGEVANFIAYAFAPAVLVTPLGALSIIVSAVLAHFILKEKLHKLGMLGCVMCIVGSVIIVIHAPQESPITSIQEIWIMATQPAFRLYVGLVIMPVFILVFHFSPRCGHTDVLVYTSICSLMGSLSVMSVKARGTSLKLTFEGKNQLIYPETWFFMLVVATCVVIQMNYLNKVFKFLFFDILSSLVRLPLLPTFPMWDKENTLFVLTNKPPTIPHFVFKPLLSASISKLYQSDK
ncbi:hypothetical protein ACJRO7_005636 [Eucalyptus globulus]|uniref:Probable magnesium transporter n=1 Tax=Eucalyptus globulus TaxID=34317 RepID=A0ABD3J3N7_EUCGL